MRVVQLCNHSFLGDYLKPSSTVLDCGANEGRFAQLIVQRYGCRVEGLEPDPQLFDKLPKLNKCTFHQMALATHAGDAQLNLAPSMKSSLVFKTESNGKAVSVSTTALPLFVARNEVAHIDLLKMDIEGAELEVLASLPEDFIKARISQITVEFHEFLDPDSIPAIQAVIQRLEAAGYRSFRFARTYGDMLFVNTARIPISRWQRLVILESKYRHGLTRMFRRVCRRSATGS